MMNQLGGYGQASGLVGINSPFTSGAGQSQATVERRPMVKEAQDNLNKVIQEMSLRISGLESRLQSVMRVEPTPGCENYKEQVDNPTTVYDEINKSSRDLDKLNQRLEDILRLLEV